MRLSIGRPVDSESSEGTIRRFTHLRDAGPRVAAHSHPIAAYKPGLFAAAGEGENAVYEFASGVAAPVAVGLMGAQDPPLSLEPIAPAPSNFEPPAVPLRSFEAILAEHAATVVEALPEPTATRRIVLTMLGGEQLSWRPTTTATRLSRRPAS